MLFALLKFIYFFGFDERSMKVDERSMRVRCEFDESSMRGP